MYRRLMILLLVALLALAGCSPAPATESAPSWDRDGGEFESAPEEPAAEAPGGGDMAGAPAAEPPATAQDGTRIVIRNADLTIVVEDPAQVMSTISAMAESMGGFVVSSNLYKSTTRSGQEVPEGNITVRVPADNLNEALSQIKGHVNDPDQDVRNENVTGQDVTKEYTDLNSRLKNLQETEQQLREIMASASRTEDVLSVYAQLTQIREQIEVIQGQIQYYQEAAALSAISVRILALASVQPIEVGGWQPVGVARDALQALVDTAQFLGSAAIWVIIYVLPVGLIIFLPLRLLWALLRRGARKSKVETPAPPTA